MPSQYKTINGIKYERDLLDLAAREAGGGALTRAAAEKLWEQAMDGNRVTQTEARTIRHIMEHYSLHAGARKYLEARLACCATEAQPQKRLQEAADGGRPLKRSRASYYMTIEGVRYEKALIELGAAMSAEGQISFKGALDLWSSANDGAGVTPTERRTLEYLLSKHRFSSDGEGFLRSALQSCRPALGDAEHVPALGGVAGAPAAAAPAAAATSGAGVLGAVGRGLWSAVQGVFGKTDAKGPPALEAPPQERPGTSGASAAETPLRVGSGATGASTAATSSTGAAGAAAALRLPRAGSESSGTSVPDARGNLLWGLTSELRALLADKEKSADAELLALADQPRPPSEPVEDDTARHRAQAAAEVDRILEAKSAEEILGPGPREAKQREFRRIARLLHADKGLVGPEDARANLAFRLALASLQRARLPERA